MEVPVVDELGLGVERRTIGRDRLAEPLDVTLVAPAGGEPRGRHLEQHADLDQLVERQVAGVGEQA